MKKLFAILCVMIAITTLLTACSFTCSKCGKESDGEKHKHEVDGEKIVLCDNCEIEHQFDEEMKEFAKPLE